MHKIIIFILCISGLIADDNIVISKPYMIRDYIIIGNGENCTLTYSTDDNLLINTTCRDMVNSRGIRIFCTPNKKLCKAEHEITILFEGEKNTPNIPEQNTFNAQDVLYDNDVKTNTNLSEVISNTPACSNGEVKAIVLDISTREIKKILLGQVFGMKISYEDARAMHKNYDNDTKRSLENIIRNVENQSSNIQLNAIRTNASDENIRKSECKAQLSLNNGNNLDISYTAQYTDDNKLFIEVFGL